MPDSSGTPPGRIVCLRHLKVFTLSTTSPCSILLHHLRIPIGASLTSRLSSSDGESPLRDYLPERSPNLPRSPRPIYSLVLCLRSTCDSGGEAEVLCARYAGSLGESPLVFQRPPTSLLPRRPNNPGAGNLEVQTFKPSPGRRMPHFPNTFLHEQPSNPHLDQLHYPTLHSRIGSRTKPVQLHTVF